MVHGPRHQRRLDVRESDRQQVAICLAGEVLNDLLLSVKPP